MAYDRMRDFTPVKLLDKSEWAQIPAEEVFLVFHPLENRWWYEYFNNNDWDLKSLIGIGQIHTTNCSHLTDHIAMTHYVQKKYPNALVAVYASYEDWVQDRNRGLPYI